MTFGALAQLVINGLKADGDTSVTLPSAGPYFSSAFGLRLQMILKAYSKDTLMLFSLSEEITVSTGDREFSFLDPANCDLEFFRVQQVWLAGNLIAKAQNVQEIAKVWTPQTPASTPTKFAQLSDTKILFDYEVADDLEDCFAQGWYRYPAIVDEEGGGDDTQLLFGDEEAMMLFDPYAQANFRKDVAQDSVGLDRLDAVNSGAAAAVRARAAQQLRLHFTAGRGNF